jgi:UDP-N-acetylmuramoyl-tripeptide--D-alanyl-D-alanine ligase
MKRRTPARSRRYHEKAMGLLSRLFVIPRMVLTPIGRRRLLWGSLFRALPLLWPFARAYRRIFLRKTRIVAVVGSLGKTTATRAVMAALGLPFERHVAWNAGGFLAAGILRIRRRARYAVFEVGIAGVGWMTRYARLLTPDVVVVTSIGSDHLAFFGTLEATRHEKAEMVRALSPSGLAVLNGDDPNVRWMATQTCARVATYGFGEDCDFRASGVTLEPAGGTRFSVTTTNTSFAVLVRLIGAHMVSPVLAGIAVALEMDVPMEGVLSGLDALSPAPERLQPLRTPQGALILLDTAKSSVETIDVGLAVLRQMPGSRKIVVLGDVEGPPGSQGPIYKRIGADLASVASRVVFVGGKTAYASVAGGAKSVGLAKENVIYAGRNILSAVEILRGEVHSGDVVWIKGRSTQHLGRIGLALAGRDVTCDAVRCPVTPGCETCPMLERKRFPRPGPGR